MTKIQLYLLNFTIIKPKTDIYNCKNMKTLTIFVLLLTIGLVSAQIRLPITTSTPIKADFTQKVDIELKPSISASLLKPISLKSITLGTIDAYQYEGEANIIIQDGESDSMSHQITFYPWSDNCQYQKCFYGYVNSYTTTNERTLEKEVIQGYGNPELEEQPIFQFGANSREDYSIKYSPSLEPIFKEMIEISCQKFNPVFQGRTRVSASTTLLTSATPARKITTPSRVTAPATEYSFKNIVADNQNYLQFGTRVSTISEYIKLKDTQFKRSFVREDIVQRDDGLVGLDKQIYDFDLGDSQEQLIKFKGEVQINLTFKNSIKLLYSEALKIVNQIEDSSNEKPRFAAFSAVQLDQARNAGFISDLIDVNPTYDSNPQPGSNDPDHFPGQMYSGVNVVTEFEKAKTPTSLSFATKITIPTKPARQGRRMLGVVQVKDLYDYKKTLYEKTIIGKKFKVQFRADCDYIILTDDHQIRCRGWADFKFFNQNKSLKLFDFTKSVSIIWQFNKPITGQWSSSVWVGLQKPKILGFKFNIKINYEILINLSSKVKDFNPFTVEVQAIANAKATTDSSAAIRVLFIEGGVFIKGTLVRAKTDPKVTAIFDFPKQKIGLKVVWYAELYAFEADWGFFYRRWRIRKGWTGRKIIKKWEIDSIYKKWKLYEDTIVINV